MTVASQAPRDQGPIVQAARIWAEKGFSVVPIRADGTKRPAVEWAAFQHNPPDLSWLTHFLEGRPESGIGIICGKVSGNLELTEIEARATTEDNLMRIYDECAKRDVDSTWLHLNFTFSVSSPSGGLHLVYRIADHEVPGNTKIARCPATAEELAASPLDKIKVLAETRGEGGYFVAPPTGGRVHPSGRAWELLGGEIGVVPTINWAERNALHEAIRAALDQMPKEEPRERAPRVERPQAAGGIATRPGDDFNSRAEWADIIEPAGWTYSHTGGDTVYWARPGKDQRDGHSATTGRAGTGSADRLYVMSSATDLPTQEPLSKFFVYAHYNHGGDLAAATRDLARQGYGDPLPRFVKPNYDAWDAPLQRAAAFSAEEEPDDGSDWSNVDSPEMKPAPDLPKRPRRREDWTVMGAANRFVNEQGRFFWYVIEEKVWRCWNGSFWERDELGACVTSAFEAMTDDMLDEADRLRDQATLDPDKAPLAKALAKHVNSLRNTNVTNLLSQIAKQRRISAEAFDADPRYLNLANGVYDLVVDQFLPHDPKYLLTKIAAVDYDPDAKAPKTEAFFGELIPSEPMREFVMQGLGYSLTGEADRKAMFILQGPSNSGKTQLNELMQTLLHDYAVPVSPGAFMKRQEQAPNPELHDARGARFVYTSETGYDLALDEDLVKRFTGKDTIKTRTLYEKLQQWIPQCVVWIATNNLPRFGSDAEAMWRRVKTVRFVNVFTDDGSSGHVAQPNIGRRLAAEEASGVFNLLLEALRRYRIAGRLAEPEELKESVQNHRQETDPVAQWLMVVQERGQLKQHVGGRASQAVMRKAYAAWCADEGFQALAAQRFGIALAQNITYTKHRSNGETWLKDWVFVGPNWITGMTGDWGQRE